MKDLLKFTGADKAYWLKISSTDTWSCEYVYEHGAVKLFRRATQRERTRLKERRARVAAISKLMTSQFEALRDLATTLIGSCVTCGGTGRAPVGEIMPGFAVPGTCDCAACADMRKALAGCREEAITLIAELAQTTP